MKTRTMKNTFGLITLLLAVIIFASSCSNLFHNNLKLPDSDSVEYASITVNAATRGARTIMPTQSSCLDDLTSIKLYGSWQGNTEQELVTGTSWSTFNANFPKQIQTGTWDFRLEAYMGSIKFTDSITSQQIVKGTTANLSFELETTATYGGLSLTIVVDSGAATKISVKVSDTSNNVIYQSPSDVALSGGSTLFSLAASDNILSQGSYIIEVSFKDSNGLLLNKFKSAVYIAKGITTRATLNYDTDNVYTIEYHNIDSPDVSQVDSTFSRALTYTRKICPVVLPEMQKTDYTFKGWFDNEECTGSPITEITSLPSSGTIKHVYAKFVLNYASITDSLGNVNVYENLDDTYAALTSASLAGETITLRLYSPVTAQDLGSSYNGYAAGKIAVGIKNTTADSVSLIIGTDAAIQLNDSYNPGMFYMCTKLTSVDLSGIDASHLSNMMYMFYSTGITTLDLSNFDTSSAVKMQSFFAGSAITNLTLGGKFTTSKVTTMKSMFEECSNLESLDLSTFDTSSVTTMEKMFYKCTSLQSLDVSSFDTKKVTAMNTMFSNCSNIIILDLSTFDTHNVTTMLSMFSSCSSLTTIYASDGFVTDALSTQQEIFNANDVLVGGKGTSYNTEYSSIQDQARGPNYARIDGGTGAKGYFTSCNYAKVGSTYCSTIDETITALANASGEIDVVLYSGVNGTALGNAITSDTICYAIKNCPAFVHFSIATGHKISVNEGNTNKLFYGCSRLLSADLRGLEISSGTQSFMQMFSGCNNLMDVNLTTLDVSEIMDFGQMFYNCATLQTLDLTGFDTSAHTNTNMQYMFRGMENVQTIIVSRKFVASTTDNADMFKDCFNLEGGAGTGYDSTIVDGTYARIDRGGSNKGYFTAANIIGEKARPTQVGDIVFKDGSATHYYSGLTLTDDIVNNAIAIIFYKGTGLNQDGNTTTERLLGVGLKQQPNSSWCVSGASAISEYMDSTIVQVSEEAGSYTFTGCVNAYNNLSLLNIDMTNHGIWTPDLSADKYPAFYFANGYRNVSGSNVSGSECEYSWYLPSIAELTRLGDACNDSTSMVNEAYYFATGNSESCMNMGNTSLMYVSSSQHGSSPQDVWFYSPSNELVSQKEKTYTNSDVYAIAIREF